MLRWGRCKFLRSVCMATFNGEKYLREQLNSILRQLSTTDELVISDDGSVDSTWNILLEYAQQDSRIKLLKGPQRGLIQNFAHAIEQANGEIIFLADQDDVWLDNKVKRITADFAAHPKRQVVVSDLVIVDEDLKTIYPSYFTYRHSKEGWLNNFVRSHYIGAGMAFRSNLKPKILPIPDDVPMHDMWIGLLGGNQVGFIREPLTLYRRHDLNASEIQTHSSFQQKLAWRFHLLVSYLKRKWQRH